MMETDVEEMIGLVEDFVFDNLPKCKGLKKNVYILKNSIIDNLHFTDDKNAFAKKVIRSSDFYDKQLSGIFKDNQVIDPDGSLAVELQSSACMYIFILLGKNFAISYSGLKNRLIEIEETSSKLQKLLEIDVETGIILAGFAIKDLENIFTLKDKSIEEHKQESIVYQLKRASEELHLFSNILAAFNETKIAEWMQFGKSGPKENLALDIWVKCVADLWVGQLGRNLSYATDPLAGREKFLQFAEACFVEVHPSLGVDAVRNAYEKLRKKGKLDYLFEYRK